MVKAKVVKAEAASGLSRVTYIGHGNVQTDRFPSAVRPPPSNGLQAARCELPLCPPPRPIPKTIPLK